MNGPGQYQVVLASDTGRNGMYLELWNPSPRELALCIFYSDADGSFEFTKYRDDVPADVETWFHEEARRRLPPLSDEIANAQ
jgi:hypothetical protein